MRFSLRAIEICRQRLGKDRLVGFDRSNRSILDEIKEDDVEKDFDELLKNGILDIEGEEPRITPLGQLLFNMMSAPEQFIKVENRVNDSIVRIYIRNTYYLCVIENKKVTESDSYDRFIFDLLPYLDLVVGAVAFGIQQDGEITNRNDGGMADIEIEKIAWDEENEIETHAIDYGNYKDDGIECTITDDDEETCVVQKEASELVNGITHWIFNKLKETESREVK